MINFLEEIKKFFDFNEKTGSAAESFDPQPKVDNSSSYVPQVYTEFVSEEVGDEVLYKEDDKDVETDNPAGSQDLIEDVVFTKLDPVEAGNNWQKDEPQTVKNETGTTINVVEMLHSLAGIIEEYDSYLQRVQNPEVKQAIELLQYRLIEFLTASGVETIKNETEFNCLEHIAVPFAFVHDGTPIKEVRRIGLIFNGRILLKALVIV